MTRVLMSVAVGMSLVAMGEPIRWIDGTWDALGAPKGRLLSDNPGWFGPQTRTGVTYSYEVAPENPIDGAGHSHKFGRRLLSGKSSILEWRMVGRKGDRPITAVFDFQRPCRFTEVDFLAYCCTNATATAQVSADKTVWSDPVAVEAVSAVTRVRFPQPLSGRYVRVTYQALPQARSPQVWWGKFEGHTFLDEVFVWGESDGWKEKIEEIQLGDALTFGNVPEGISILPMPVPHLWSKPSGSTPGKVGFKMARNETESRYFAIVNGGSKPVRLKIAKPEFGENVRSELLVGGVVLFEKPPKELSEQEKIQAGENLADRQALKVKLDVKPFFFPESLPDAEFARRHLANHWQVVGFPDKVLLRAGEGCVAMLRVTSSNAAPGMRTGVLAAGGRALPFEVTVVDLELPPQRMWISPWEPFSFQEPFESASRVRRDVERYIGLGATTVKLLPEKNSKESMFFRRVPQAMVGGDYDWCARGPFKKVGAGDFDKLTEAERAEIVASAKAYLAHAKELGVSPDRVALYLNDEPCLGNAASVMKLARLVKDAVPEARLHSDPLFFKGAAGFDTSDDILKTLGATYNECIDISCPITAISFRPELMDALWKCPRMFNACYNHPAGRIGVETAYCVWRNGFNGFGYYSYYIPLGRDPWDARTFGVLGYHYQAVMPLENDVAITQLYDTLHESSETVRMLDALKASGKLELLNSVLERSKTARARTHFQWDLATEADKASEDVLTLRDDILSAFLTPRD